MVSRRWTSKTWPLLLAALCLLSNALAVAALDARAHALHRLSARLHGKALASSSAHATAQQRDKQELTSAMPGAEAGIQVRFVAQPHHRNLVGQEGATIVDYLENVKSSVLAAIQESHNAAVNEGSENGDGDHVLHVLLGAEWRIRKTVHEGQFSEKDFQSLIEELDRLSKANPTWVLAPGTMMFELDELPSSGGYFFKLISALTSGKKKHVVVNCLPVSFNGQTHVICKKGECDMLDYEEQTWGYDELSKRDTFGTRPHTTVNFQGHDIKIGIDICLDSSDNRLLSELEAEAAPNTVDIYLVSADGGSITEKTAVNALANGALAFKVDLMHSNRPDQRVVVKGKDFVDGSLHSIKQFQRGTTGPDPVQQPFVVFQPLVLPWHHVNI